MIYIGIDISKYKHDCFICKNTGEVIVEKIGFREISIDGKVFKINGRACDGRQVDFKVAEEGGYLECFFTSEEDGKKYSYKALERVGINYALSKDRAREIIELYGADKVIFGTDFPMWKQEEELKQKH